MIRKKIISGILAAGMVLQICPSAVYATDIPNAVQETTDDGITLDQYVQAKNKANDRTIAIWIDEGDNPNLIPRATAGFDSFEDFWKGINEGFYITMGNNTLLIAPKDKLPASFSKEGGRLTVGEKQVQAYSMESLLPKDQPLVICVGEVVQTRAAESNTFTMADEMTIDRDLVIKYGAYDAGVPATYDVSLSFTNNITIQDGGSLTFVNNSQGATLKPSGQISFSNPIKVEDGGTLDLGAFISNEDQYTTYTYTGATGSLIEAAEGSTVDISAVKLTSTTSTDPVIDTEGDLNLVPRNEGSKDYRTVIEATGTAITAKNGSTVTLDKINVSATGSSSAISVEEGATIEIPENTTVEITAANDNAITLAQNATAKIGEQTVKAGNEGAVVDNNRNLLGSAGTTIGDTSTASAGEVLMTATGDVYEAPVGETITKANGVYDLPAGTKTDEGITLEAGGSVGSSDGVLEEKANSITLDRSAVSLYHNTDNNTVQLTATVDPETVPVTWASSDSSVASVSADGLVTAHKDGAATITATAGGQTARCTVYVSTYTYTGKYSYEIVSDVGENGTIDVDRYATEGDKVTITVSPDEAYLLDDLTVTSGGKDVALTDNGDGTYTFTMPSGDVKIAATFAEDPDWEEPEEPATDVSEIFTDVPANHWAKAAIQYVYDNGLMTGVSDTAFAPEATTTRAMIVSMLARMKNVTSAADAGFSDVDAGDWYATAVNWAAANGIVNGISDDTFAPNTAITREQLAAMLMNYAQYKGMDVSARADLSGYTDAPSTWASEAVQWAVAEGLLAGVTDDQLQPQGQATRAQVAAILERFLEA